MPADDKVSPPTTTNTPNKAHAILPWTTHQKRIWMARPLSLFPLCAPNSRIYSVATSRHLRYPPPVSALPVLLIAFLRPKTTEGQMGAYPSIYPGSMFPTAPSAWPTTAAPAP